MGGVDGQVASRQQAARIAARDGRPAEALAHMEAACQLAPDRGDLHFQLACLHALGGAFEPALEHFRTTTRLLPDFADGWRLLGTTLVRTRRVGEARQALRRAHELAPGDVPALRALAEMEFLHGWPADALPLWQALLDRDAGDIEARLRTGESLHRLGDQARAVAVFNEGVRLAPGSDALWL